MRNILDKIAVYEDLAKNIDKIKESFLKNRQQRVIIEKRAQEAAAPIVTPIVKAIAEAAPAPVSERKPLSKNELERLLRDLTDQKITGLPKKGFAKSIQNIYQDEQLFNVLLSLTRDEIYTGFPVDKMKKFGFVESLIFYGQGGKNLDLIPAMIHSTAFQSRLENFENFYSQNAEAIRTLLAPHEEDTLEADDGLFGADTFLPENRNAHDSGDEFYDVFYNSTSGEGLSDRLNLLAASRDAGNTSVDIVNEAYDILKQLLDDGRIDKGQYTNLQKLFD